MESRWKKRFAITIACFIGFLLFFPATICGCHFHIEGIIPPLIPIIWAGYALSSYKDRNEQIIGWIALMFALVSAWGGYEGNLRFLH